MHKVRHLWNDTPMAMLGVLLQLDQTATKCAQLIGEMDGPGLKDLEEQGLEFLRSFIQYLSRESTAEILPLTVLTLVLMLPLASFKFSNILDG
ncbi:hypothetical protein Tco_0152439 [Tanacetum coccineum]